MWKDSKNRKLPSICPTVRSTMLRSSPEKYEVYKVWALAVDKTWCTQGLCKHDWWVADELSIINYAFAPFAFPEFQVFVYLLIISAGKLIRPRPRPRPRPKLPGMVHDWDLFVMRVQWLLCVESSHSRIQRQYYISHPFYGSGHYLITISLGKKLRMIINFEFHRWLRRDVIISREIQLKFGSPRKLEPRIF